MQVIGLTERVMSCHAVVQSYQIILHCVVDSENHSQCGITESQRKEDFILIIYEKLFVLCCCSATHSAHRESLLKVSKCKWIRQATKELIGQGCCTENEYYSEEPATGEFVMHCLEGCKQKGDKLAWPWFKSSLLCQSGLFCSYATFTEVQKHIAAIWW